MPLSRFTHTLPLACAAAISALEFPDAVWVFLGTAAEAGTEAAAGEFAPGIEAAAAGAGGALAGSAAESVVITFLRRCFLGFLNVSEFVSVDAPCAHVRTGGTTVVSSTESSTAHKVSLRLG